MKKLSKTLLMSPAVSLVLPAAFFVSFNSAYASLVDTSQNQTFESRPQAAAVSKRPVSSPFIKLAAVHFLGNDWKTSFGNQEFLPEDICKQGGYTHKGCPAGYVKGEACPEDGSYVKDCIDPDTWCKNNGYEVTGCQVPQYPQGACPYGSGYYKSCETDNIRACKELGYSLTCEAGKVGDTNQSCPYNESYKKCVCNPCGGYDYTASEANAQGYTPGEVCNSCGTMKYKRSANVCDGFKECTDGGAAGAEVCYSGSLKKFSECKEVCDPKFQYDSSNCTGDKVLTGNSCGGKYEKCTSPCGSEYAYDESNCPADKNFHCTTPCGNKYSDCKPALFTGKTIDKNGMTYALNEDDCPGMVKRFVVYGNTFRTISNGLQTYTACTTADLICADLAKSLFNRGNTDNNININLAGDIYCGNEMLRNEDNWYGKVTTVINGNGHTITFDKPTGTDIFVSDAGPLTFKNVKLVSRQTAAKNADNNVCGKTNGVSNRELVDRSTYYDDKVYFENVTVETQASVGYPITTGTCWFKRTDGGTGGDYDQELGYPESTGGILNVNGFERSNNGYGMVINGGTVNYKAGGTSRVTFTFKKGTLNVCADKVLIISSSTCESGTINSSTQDVSISESCKSRVTVNYQPELCSSNSFAGNF